MRIGKRFQMAKDVIAQVIFNFSRDANHKPAREKLKNTLSQCQYYQQSGIHQDLLVRAVAGIQIIYGAFNELWCQHAQAAIKQHSDCAPEQRNAILVEIRPERLEIL